MDKGKGRWWSVRADGFSFLPKGEGLGCFGLRLDMMDGIINVGFQHDVSCNELVA